MLHFVAFSVFSMQINLCFVCWCVLKLQSCQACCTQHLSLQRNNNQNVCMPCVHKRLRDQYLLYVVGHIVWGDSLLKGALYRSCRDRKKNPKVTQSDCRLFDSLWTFYCWLNILRLSQNYAIYVHKERLSLTLGVMFFFIVTRKLMRNSRKMRKKLSSFLYCARRSWHRKKWDGLPFWELSAQLGCLADQSEGLAVICSPYKHDCAPRVE